jgi:aspartate-semialdehyde dehydrogenase
MSEFIDSYLRVSVTCNRIPVLDGHTECFLLRSVNRPPPTISEVRDARREYTSEVQTLCLSAPKHSIIVHDENAWPQPRLDRSAQNGFSCSVVRIQEHGSGIFYLQFTSLSHDTTLGAARSSILNAEHAILKGYI